MDIHITHAPFINVMDGIGIKLAKSVYPLNMTRVCLRICSLWKVDKIGFVRYFNVIIESQNKRGFVR